MICILCGSYHSDKQQLRRMFESLYEIQFKLDLKSSNPYNNQNEALNFRSCEEPLILKKKTTKTPPNKPNTNWGLSMFWSLNVTDWLYWYKEKVHYFIFTGNSYPRNHEQNSTESKIISVILNSSQSSFPKFLNLYPFQAPLFMVILVHPSMFTDVPL